MTSECLALYNKNDIHMMLLKEHFENLPKAALKTIQKSNLVFICCLHIVKNLRKCWT